MSDEEFKLEGLEEEGPRGGDIAFRYVGKSWVSGVPARDLTYDEADRIGWDVLRHIVCAHNHQPLYEEVG